MKFFCKKRRISYLEVFCYRKEPPLIQVFQLKRAVTDPSILVGKDRPWLYCSILVGKGHLCIQVFRWETAVSGTSILLVGKVRLWFKFLMGKGRPYFQVFWRERATPVFQYSSGKGPPLYSNILLAKGRPCIQIFCQERDAPVFRYSGGKGPSLVQVSNGKGPSLYSSILVGKVRLWFKSLMGKGRPCIQVFWWERSASGSSF